jgi:hypothetical protein
MEQSRKTDLTVRNMKLGCQICFLLMESFYMWHENVYCFLEKLKLAFNFHPSFRTRTTMGNDTSLPLAPVPPGFSTMCISLQYSDAITILHHDSGALSTIRQAIFDTWPNGIQREWATCGSGWSIKVKGI